MKKTACIIILAFICIIHLACAQNWTEEAARQEAFRNVKYNIDVSQYPAFDPDFQENKKALEAGKESARIDNRFISRNPEPPIGYLVSKIDQRYRPLVTMFYGNDGHLISVRLFSQPEYPRIAYIYCVDEEDCRYDNKEYRSGDLMSISCRVSDNEEFYFLPDGKCTGRVRF